MWLFLPTEEAGKSKCEADLDSLAKEEEENTYCTINWWKSLLSHLTDMNTGIPKFFKFQFMFLSHVKKQWFLPYYHNGNG